MNINDLLQAVSTVGFPIVCCAVLFYQNWKQNEMHKEETSKITEALNNNTLALTRLIDKIESEG